MTGVVQHYAWGDTTFLPELLGRTADGRPWAELWFGTHRGGPATLDGDVSLLGTSGELPYLLKVLAASEPLSLQTHPTREQAEAGFAREERDARPIDATDRIYRDPSPKPELICALTPFDALCGFRPVAATVALLRAIGAVTLAEHLAMHGLARTVHDLASGVLAIESTIAACRAGPAADRHPEATLVDRLAAQYPDDPSVVITLLLNRVLLAPGEAIFLDPGNLHAYLHGVGVEIMGASDNVVRGGLTTKHVDVPELLRVLDVRELTDPRVIPIEIEPGAWCYDTAAADTPFRLWRHEITDTWHHLATGREMLLCTAGATDLLGRGEAAYLAPYERITMRGTATVFRVEEC